jgi:DNA mismatch repair protein MutL
MNRIRLLSDELISQIAAGEVIERPASALKELVENSIDAGATQISIELEEGGLEKIRVVDDGCGMTGEEARTAFLRHATSKIKSLEDLFTIKSLGFRGEALASIASISRLSLKTRPAEERVGTRVEMDGGKELSVEETACPVGTDVTVLALFHATPARKKYMKSVGTEYGHCFDMLSQIGMSHPEVGFRLSKDGTLVFELPPRQDLKERIRILYGGSIADALLPLHYQQSNLRISGFVGKPELSRSSRKYQFLFVNGRAIESRLVARAVEEAFHSLLMTDKHPWFAVTIEMDPTFLDVNVHPRKLEVKFVNTQEVYRAVFGAVQHALQNSMIAPVLGRQNSSDFMPTPSLEMVFEPRPVLAQQERRADAVEHPMEARGVLFKPVAQVANCYIVAESEEGLVLIDQHAAHERVRYARLMKSLEEKQPMLQPLLTPLSLDLGVESLELIRGHLDEFLALGFDLDPFGGNTYLLRAVPDGLQKKDPERVMREVLADVARDECQKILPVREALVTSAACRGAIKFGDSLSMIEMEALLRDMADTPNYTHCPHGRPALITWTYGRLEELFKRKNF